MSDELTTGQELTTEGAGGDTSLFDEVMGAATVGEEVIDPKAGRHDNAILSEVTTKLTRSGDKKYIAITWGGLKAKDGFDFEQVQMVFSPEEQDLEFRHGAFLELLRNLEIIPAGHKKRLMFTAEGMEKLAAAISTKKGQEFPITVKPRGDFYDVRVRKRPKTA